MATLLQQPGYEEERLQRVADQLPCREVQAGMLLSLMGQVCCHLPSSGGADKRYLEQRYNTKNEYHLEQGNLKTHCIYPSIIIPSTSYMMLE